MKIHKTEKAGDSHVTATNVRKWGNKLESRVTNCTFVEWPYIDCLSRLLSLQLMFTLFQFLCGDVYIFHDLLNKCQVNYQGVRSLGLKSKKSPKTRLDSIDIQIIRALEQDSRVSSRKLAQRVGVTPNILHNHVKDLENEGIILGYVPVVDAAKMGYALTAIIMIQIEGGHILEVENEIAKENNVLSVYDITGEYDAVVFAKFRDNSSLNAFLKKLLTERFIKRTTTLLAFNSVKEYSQII